MNTIINNKTINDDNKNIYDTTRDRFHISTGYDNDKSKTNKNNSSIQNYLIKLR